MQSIFDFPAVIMRTKTMTDKGIRVEMDLPETETDALSIFHKMQRDSVILRVVLYDDREFQKQLIAGK